MNKIEEYGWIYLVNKNEGFKGCLYLLPIEDCMKFCEDKRSKGTGWCFMWTSLKHVMEDKSVYGEIKKYQNFLILKDNGKQDDLFDDLGIEKPDFEWMDEFVKQFGYKLKKK